MQKFGRCGFQGIVCFSILSLLGACAQQPHTRQLDELRELKPISTDTISITGLRHVALRDAALSLGARGGLAWRAQQINKRSSRYSQLLDRIFNFNAMLLEDNVLPPVLIEARKTLEQSSPDALRIAERAYVISQQAQFVTATPTWRDYIWLKFTPPEKPDQSLLPRNDMEQQVWDRYVQEGWQAGILQADSIFTENLGRLKRDYEGMIRYRTLLAQNMVSPPYVANMNLGITGSNSELAINDRVLRITAMPAFLQDGGKWRTEITATSPKA